MFYFCLEKRTQVVYLLCNLTFISILNYDFVFNHQNAQ